MYAVTGRDLARQDRRAAGRTYGVTHGEPGKVGALRRHLINGGCGGCGMTVNSQVPISPVIGENKDDVGPPKDLYGAHMLVGTGHLDLFLQDTIAFYTNGTYRCGAFRHFLKRLGAGFEWNRAVKVL